MSTYNMVGTGVYVLDKVQQIQEAVKLYQEATNPNTKEQAAYDIATKTCEAIGIGIASYFAEKLTTKTGLDRVFDSLRKNKSFEKYLQDQVTTQTLQGYGVSTILGWILNSTRNFIIENRYLDPVFQEFDDIGTWLGGELYDLLNPKLDIDMENISEKYSSDLDKSATYRIVYIDPLTLDLDGDGIETTGESGRSGVMFDTDTDGVKVATGWISADDGLLVRDINKNGVIDNGSELFGDSTALMNGSTAANGFSALTDLDDNHDGKVDANDAAFSELKVWRDLNQDGVSSTDELFGLSDVTVASLNEENTHEFISLTGSNYISQTGTYTKSDGTTAVMADVNFITNHLITEYKDKIAVSEEIAGLPNLTGYGRLRSLQEAATLSPVLAEILKQYAVATTKNQQMALIDDLVLEWAKTDPQWDAYGTKEYSEGLTYDPNSSNVIYLRRGETYIPTMEDPTPVHRDIYHIADAFFNRKTLSVCLPRNSTPNNDPLRIAERTYTQIQNSIYGSLLAQTRLKPYLDNIELVFDETGIHISYDKMNAMLLANSTGDNLKNGLDDLKDLERVVGGSLTDWNMKETYITIGELNDFNENFIFYSKNSSIDLFDLIAGSDSNNQISGSVKADLISGYAGNDNLSGGNGNDYLVGGADNDTINGGNDDDSLVGDAGNDLLNGNSGNDYLVGGADNDTLNGGDGDDSLIGAIGNDSLAGGKGNDIYTFVAGDGTDTLSDCDFTADNADVVQFSDVKSTDITALERIGSSLVLRYGTADQLIISNYFSGTAYGIEQFQFSDGVIWDSAVIKATVITVGDSNNNAITGYSDGTNRIYGLDGNDALNGGALDDTIDGGNGRDNLTGNNGNDYLTGGADNDTLNGSDGDDLLVGDVGNDSLNGGNGNDHLMGGADNDTLNGNDGDDLLIGDVGNDLFDGGNGNDYLMGGVDNDTLNGGNHDDSLVGDAGNDVLNGGYGNDYLVGGADNDTLNGGDGDDSLIGAIGNDSLAGGKGNDIYTFMTGDGIDTLSDYDLTTDNMDTVQLSDVKSTEITALERVGSSLVLRYGTTDQLTISNYFSGTAYGIEQFQFSDGVVWDSAAIKSTAITVGDSNSNTITGYSDGTNRIYGLDGNDYLSGGALNDTIDGGNGRDNLTGNNGNDYLMGGADNDMLNGSDGDDLLVGDVGNDVLNGGYGNDHLMGGADNDTLNGNDGDDSLVGDIGNDLLNGSYGNDYLMGGADNDTLNGGDGDDSLIGAIGNDSLIDGKGNDIYTFMTGDGTDTISDYDVTIDNTDIVQLSDVKSTELTALERIGSSLVLRYGTADQLTISNYFSSTAYGIEQFQFSDGVVWNTTEIKSRVVMNGDSNNNSITGYSDGANRIYGLDGNDALNGGALNDTIDGGNGRDNLIGNNGNDYLIGGADNDTLNGGEGDDALIGGIGNDSLVGGKGNDLYTFMTGDGADMISDYDTTVGYTDVLQLQDITADQLWFTKSGNNLDVSVIGTTDKMTVQNWYSSNAYHVEQFKSSDGKTLLDSQVANLVSAMASMAPPAAGQTTLPQNYQDQLSAVLAANWK